MSSMDLQLSELDLLTLPRPAAEYVEPDHRREKYKQRCDALQAVLSGSTVNAASKLFHVPRKTLSRIVAEALNLAPDGKPHGFRVCLPYYRAVEATPDSTPDQVIGPGPHSFGRLLKSYTSLDALIAGFNAALPAHNAPSRKFDALYKKFKAELERLGRKGRYPLDRPDRGRRALLEEIKRRRRHLLCAALQTTEDDGVETTTDSAAKLFQSAPLDRMECDGHRIDVNWCVRVPLPDGTFTTRPISRLWILALIDSTSKVVHAVKLVVADAYNQGHVLELLSKACSPWVRRELIVPGLAYGPEAWMPTACDTAEHIPRASSIALDNALAHHAKLVTHNFAEYLHGVVNLGFPYTPQARPNIEAFFKIIEERLLRKLAGSFRPGSPGEESTATTALDPAKHPIDVDALEDVIDVWVSEYNASEHLGLQGRSPRAVHEAHLQSGLWTTCSPLTASDAIALNTAHLVVTIRGSKSGRKPPHVNWENGIYRSAKLYTRWDLIGRDFDATVHLGDVRTMTLWDKRTASPFVVLTVLPPYAATAHSLDERRRIAAWRDRAGKHEDFGDDISAAYHAFVRSNAATLKWAADAYAAAPRPAQSTKNTSTSSSDELSPMLPRSGRVNLFGKGS